MFAARLDDFKRRVVASGKPFEIKVLATCTRNTPGFDDWYEKWNADTNTTIHMTMEDDYSTYSFWEVAMKEENTDA